jgi:hypothetical protein
VGIAIIGTQQTGQHGNGRGFPCPVRPEQAENLALFHVKIHALHSVILPKRFAQTLNADSSVIHADSSMQYCFLHFNPDGQKLPHHWRGIYLAGWIGDIAGERRLTQGTLEFI